MGRSSVVCACVLSNVLAIVPAHAQRDFSNVQIKATHVRGAVHMLQGAGGNIGVSVGEDGILIVDDQFAPLADRIRKALREIDQGKVRLVLNTHWHQDHTGGNVEFGTEAAVVAHENVRKRLATPQRVRGEEVGPSPSKALPIITFDESLTIHFNGEEIRMFHLPHGHTDGDSAVFFAKSNVVHMGDLFFAGKFPFVDLDSGGDVEGYTKNVETILKMIPADAMVIPGHGPLSTVEDLKAFHGMLVETTGVVRKAIAAGKSIEEIKAAGLPKKWDSWGDWFIKTDAWLECIHRSLTRPPEPSRE